MSLFLLLLMLITCKAQDNPFMGTVLSYYRITTTTSPNVPFTVNIRYKVYFQMCPFIYWECLTGDCGGEYTVEYTVMISGTEGWCQREGVSTRQLTSNAPFQLWLNGGNWMSNENGIVSSKAVSWIELRTRSDTGEANTSPQTTILTNLTVPSNCGRVYSLLTFDPDGDDVRCRPGNASLSECDNCTLPLGFSLVNCTFSMPNVTVMEGSLSYAIQLVMEDFPRQTITLTQSDGTQTTLTTSDAISKIPVQFVFQVGAPAPSCTNGLYIPKFLPPTPSHGAQLFTTDYENLQINIIAQANVSTVSGILVSGPYNVIQSSSGPGQFTLMWTSTQNEAGESLPICFVVEATLNSDVYQSALRCVIVIVGDITTTIAPSPLFVPAANTSTPPPTSMTPPATYVVVLSVKVSSWTPLSDIDISSAIQQVKDILVSLGLPQDITIGIVSTVQQ